MPHLAWREACPGLPPATGDRPAELDGFVGVRVEISEGRRQKVDRTSHRGYIEPRTLSRRSEQAELHTVRVDHRRSLHPDAQPLQPLLGVIEPSLHFTVLLGPRRCEHPHPPSSCCKPTTLNRA